MDFIIANDVSRNDIAFNADENEVLIISRDKTKTLRKASKTLVAHQIFKLHPSRLDSPLIMSIQQDKPLTTVATLQKLKDEGKDLAVTAYELLWQMLLAQQELM